MAASVVFWSSWSIGASVDDSLGKMVIMGQDPGWENGLFLSKSRHGTFLYYWSCERGIHQSPVDSLHKGPVMLFDATLMGRRVVRVSTQGKNMASFWHRNCRITMSYHDHGYCWLPMPQKHKQKKMLLITLLHFRPLRMQPYHAQKRQVNINHGWTYPTRLKFLRTSEFIIFCRQCITMYTMPVISGTFSV